LYLIVPACKWLAPFAADVQIFFLNMPHLALPAVLTMRLKIIQKMDTA